MSIKTLPLDSFESYISELKLQLETPDKDYEYYYRGCSVHDWQYNLIPGIYRKDSSILKEHINFREMILRSPNDFLNEKTTLEKLVKMQHYRLPTRLLNITSNPLVALYFACQTFDRQKQTNGKVYVFKINKDRIKYYDSDAVCVISNLAKLSKDKTNFTSDGFGYLMHEIRDEKPQFQDIINEIDIKDIFPVKVKLNNNRIVRQSGAFLIFGMESLNSKEKPASIQDNIIEKEIIIDERGKEKILNSLESLAINENTLFPELDYQANYLDR